jgi:hypothetical protein
VRIKNNANVVRLATLVIGLLLICAMALPNVAADRPPSPTASSTPAPKVPPIATANVDGIASEWNLAYDFFYPLYDGWDNNNKGTILANSYIRYDASSQTVYVLVLAETVGLSGNDVNWISISNYPSGVGDTSNKVVTAATDDDGITPDFHYVGLSSDGVTIQGYEASFKLAPGTYYITIHMQIQGNGGQGATAGTPIKTVPVTFELPEGIFAPSLAAMFAAFVAMGTLGLLKRKNRKA